MSIKQSHELKQLESRLTKAQAEHATALADLKAAQKLEASLRSQAEDLKRRVDQAKSNSKGPVISEHALLRYFERVLGYDLEAIKAQFVPKETAKLIQAMGSGKYPGVGCRLVVQGNTVVTIET